MGQHMISRYVPNPTVFQLRVSFLIPSDVFSVISSQNAVKELLTDQVSVRVFDLMAFAWHDAIGLPFI